MQSVSDALNRLHEDGSWFARAHEVKLLVVRTTPDTHGAALKLLPMLEFHHDNRSGWVLFEDAHTKADDGWFVRSNRLVEHWGQRRDAFAKEGVQLGEVGLPPAGAKGPRVFRDTSTRVLKELRDPLTGLVYVLAPALVEDAADFETDLTEMVGAPEMARARFVVVIDDAVAPPQRLLDAVGQRAIVCDCRVDQADKSDDMRTLLATGDTPNFGMAGPKGVTPPKRVDDPPPLDEKERDKALEEAGINPKVLTESPKLRNCVLGAAIEMKEGNGAKAVELQRQARDIAAACDLKEVKVICQIALASYLSGLDRRELAIKELEDASKYSEENEMPQPQCEAELALGLLHALDGRQREAAVAYAKAGSAAETANNDMLAIEAWRLAGQLALDANQQPQAIQAFQRAISLAEGAPPDVAATSSAPEAARRLADVCRKRGLHPQAQALDEQADRLEAGKPDEQAAAPAVPS